MVFDQSIFLLAFLSVRIFFAVAKKIVGQAVFNSFFSRTAFARHEAINEVECGGCRHAEKKVGKCIAFLFFEVHKKFPFRKSWLNDDSFSVCDAEYAKKRIILNSFGYFINRSLKGEEKI